MRIRHSSRGGADEAIGVSVALILGSPSFENRSTTMLLLTGRDVWEAIVKLGWQSGSYDPKTNRHCANAEALAGLLDQVLSKRQNWLPNLVENEDAMQEGEASTPR